MRKVTKLAQLFPSSRFRRGLRHGVAASVELRAVAFRHDFRCVLDVGANRGQFTLLALECFPHAHVIAFEPLAAAARTYRRVTAGDRPRARVVETALGAVSGTVDLHVSRQDDSSSVLPIGPAQVRHFPGTEAAATVPVAIAALDEALGTADLDRPVLLKIDVQGLEYDVLRGAKRTLAAVDEVLVEASFAELYSGQVLAPAVIELLGERGFRMAGVYNPAMEEESRAVLQADFHFVRTSL